MNCYLEPNQTCVTKTQTVYENLLGDSIERAYADGIHEIGSLINYLNQFGPQPQEDDIWTELSFLKLMSQLGR